MDPDLDPPNWRSPFSPARLYGLITCAAILFVCLCAATSGDSPGDGARALTTSATLPIAWSWALPLFLLGLLGSAHFTIMNYALFALNSEEIEELARRNPSAAQAIRHFHRDLDHTWLTLLTGSLLFDLFMALICGHAIVSTLQSDLPANWPAILLAIAAATLAVLALGEIAPGMLAARRIKALAPSSVRFLQFWHITFLPLTFPIFRLLNVIARLRHIDMAERTGYLEAEKTLLTLIGIGNVDMSLEEEEREMIDHVLEFGQSCAGDIMTPRMNIIGFDESCSQETALDIMRHAPRSRVLVFKKNLDNILGILHTKQILLNPDSDYHSMVKPAIFVEDTTDLVDLLALMRANRTQLVVVLDAYGATRGVVSFDDLLAAIVGDIGSDTTEEEATQ